MNVSMYVCMNVCTQRKYTGIFSRVHIDCVTNDKSFPHHILHKQNSLAFIGGARCMNVCVYMYVCIYAVLHVCMNV